MLKEKAIADAEGKTDEPRIGMSARRHKNRALEFLAASELDVAEHIGNKDYVYKKRAGQWHCSNGPAIVNDGGPLYMIHGIGASEETLGLWRQVATLSGKDPDDPLTLKIVLSQVVPGEAFDLRLSRTVAALQPK